MGISSIGSTLVTAATGQGASSTASPVVGSSLPNGASASNTTVSAQAPTPAQVTQAIKQVNNAFTQNNQNMYATIGTDKATGIEVVKIVDKDTHEVVSQYPSKAVLAIAQSLQQPQGSGGQLIDTTA